MEEGKGIRCVYSRKALWGGKGEGIRNEWERMRSGWEWLMAKVRNQELVGKAGGEGRDQKWVRADGEIRGEDRVKKAGGMGKDARRNGGKM